MTFYDHRRRIYAALDTPFGRPLLAAIASSYKSAVYHRPCLVWYHGGQWIHRHPDGYLVERQIMLQPIRKFNEMNTDYYLHTYRLQPGDVAIDCGASTGWETLLFSRLVGPTGRVISIEAHPVAYECLAEMCHRNNLTNVITLQCAVGDKPGTACITDSPDHQTNAVVKGGGHGFTVNIRTIDDIAADLGHPVNLIKMNIEGAELAALRGAEETLRSTCHVAVSCHDFLAKYGCRTAETVCTKSQVRALLERAGFQITERSDHPLEFLADFLYGDRRPN